MIAPRYVRLSGEIADQAMLDNLRAAYPQARARPCLCVDRGGRRLRGRRRTGRLSRPASSMPARGASKCKIEDGSLRIPLGARRAPDISAPTHRPLPDAGRICRYRRHGRAARRALLFRRPRGGIINVGGLKVHPEEVEAVINRHPSVSHVPGEGAQEPDHRRHSRWPKWCSEDADGTTRARSAELKRGDHRQSAAAISRPTRCRPLIRFVPRCRCRRPESWLRNA